MLRSVVGGARLLASRPFGGDRVIAGDVDPVGSPRHDDDRTQQHGGHEHDVDLNGDQGWPRSVGART